MGDLDDLAAIRQRHAEFVKLHGPDALVDRGVLLDKVDRLLDHLAALKQEVRIAQGERLRAVAELQLTHDKLAYAIEGRSEATAEVERLTAELVESREAYDTVCRMIGSSLRGSERSDG